MLESLDINGRTYVPCDVAATEVGYAASYIERLAQGRWIDASFVQGQCFVDITSLMTFIASTEHDAYVQLADAAKREQIDAVLNEYEKRLGSIPLPSKTWLMLGEVGVLTACGLLLGVVSFSALQADLTWREMAYGISQSASVLHERVASPAAVIEFFDAVTPTKAQ